jgi:aspartyl aminopeptidase
MTTESSAYSPKNAWEVYTKPEDRDAMKALVCRYLAFLTKCKTERETIAYVQKRLAEVGFSKSFEQGKVMLPMRGKSLFVARRGAAPLAQGVHLIAAHADTPRLDFKQRPLVEQPTVAQAKTHYYGGIRKYQWLARPLALHGVLVKEDGSLVTVTLGEAETDPVFTIADLLPHLAQKQNLQSVADAFEGEKLNIILGHSPLVPAAGTEADEKPKEAVKSRLLDILLHSYNIAEEDFVSAELQAVPAGAARLVGFDRALVGGYGQDDRICVFTALEALLAVEEPHSTIALMLWDKEEIGSDGATGASSRFMQYCFEDMAEAWGEGERAAHIMLQTKALSADVQAALDPDFQEIHEKQNAALLGYGPCFSKFTGSRGKYGASEADAEFLGWMRSLYNSKGIPWQIAELGKVDHGGGGTVALFLAAYGMHVIDLGPAVLSMHSPFELASVVDIYASVQAFKAFYAA